MNNITVEEIKIKLRGDNVYDVYFNGEWIGYAGHYVKALDVVKEFIEQANKSNVVCGLVKFTNSAV